MTTEPPAASRAPKRSGYITDRAAMIGEFRTAGTEPERFSLMDAPAEVKAALALECVFLLRSKGDALADILSGAAIPDRLPPVVKEAAPKPVSIRTQAVIATLADEFFAIAKERTPGRISKQQEAAMMAVANAEAVAHVAARSAEWLAAAKLRPAVLLKLDGLRKQSTSLLDLEVEADPTEAVPGGDADADIGCLIDDPIATDVAAELAGEALSEAAD